MSLDFESLLARMIGLRASDMFLAEGRPASFRVDGGLVSPEPVALPREVLGR